MEMRVDKFRKILGLLQLVVPKKSTLSVTYNVRIADGRVTATDLQTAVSVGLEGTNGDSFLLPYRQAMECLKYVQGDMMLTVALVDKSVTLSWQGGSAAFPVPAVKEFPEVTMNQPVSEAVLDGDKLINALGNALRYVAHDNARPVLAGVAVTLGDNIQVVGADGFRASFESLKMSYPAPQVIIVPADAIRILDGLWHKAPGKPGLQQNLVAQITAVRPLTFGLVPGKALVRFGDISVLITLIAGTPPDVLQLLSSFKEPIKVRVMAADLLMAVKRLRDIANSGAGIIKLKWSETSMEVSASSESSGSGMAEIPVTVDGGPGRIALSVHYLLEYLADKDGVITLGTEDRETPALLHFGTKPIVVVMPMYVAWPDDPVKEPEDKKAAGEPLAETEGNSPEDATNQEENPGEEEESGTEQEPVAAAPAKKRRGGKKKKDSTE